MKQIPSHSVNSNQKAIQYDVYDYLTAEEQIEELVKESTVNFEEYRDLFFYNTSDEKYNKMISDFKYFIGFKIRNHYTKEYQGDFIICQSNDYLKIQKELQRFILLLKYFKNKKYSIINYMYISDVLHISVRCHSIRRPNYSKLESALSKKLMTTVILGA